MYPVRRKNEQEEIFKTFKLEVEKEKGLSIGNLKSDGGGKYCSKAFASFLEGEGIKRIISPPNSPFFNGKAERRNRKLMESVRSVLNQSGLPHQYWAEALLYVNLIQNKLDQSLMTRILMSCITKHPK